MLPPIEKQHAFLFEGQIKSAPSTPMHRYFLFLSYHGAAYHGWQVQPNAVSVQQKINEALSLLLGQTVSITGAGRTDTGVHAKKMAAHFDSEKELDTKQTAYRLNRILPPDIAIHELREVRPEAHARFDAQERTYHYFLCQHKDPFLTDSAAHMPFELDFKKMNEAAKMLLSVSDFTSFSKLHTDAKTNICRLKRAVWEEVSPGVWRFEITADRFLRNMVRAVVGTLLEVGRGKKTLEDFRQIIESRNRCAAGDSVPAHGLFLVDVVYPTDIFL